MRKEKKGNHPHCRLYIYMTRNINQGTLWYHLNVTPSAPGSSADDLYIFMKYGPGMVYILYNIYPHAPYIYTHAVYIFLKGTVRRCRWSWINPFAWINSFLSRIVSFVFILSGYPGPFLDVFFSFLISSWNSTVTQHVEDQTSPVAPPRCFIFNLGLYIDDQPVLYSKGSIRSSE